MLKNYDAQPGKFRTLALVVRLATVALIAAPGPLLAEQVTAADPRSPEIKLIDDYNFWFIVQGAFQGDVGAMRVGLPRYITDQTILHEAESLPWGGTMVGYDGWARLCRISGPIWSKVQKSLTTSGGRYYQQGSVVLHEVTMRLAGTKASPQPFVMSIMEKYTVENGRITRIDEFYSDTAGFMKQLSLLGAIPTS